MKLIDVMKALSGNLSLYIIIRESGGEDLIQFAAPGYKQIESDLGERTVEEIQVCDVETVKVLGVASVVLTLAEEVDP